MPTTTHKVLKLRILKPADGSSWKELATTLRDTRYRVFRLANLAVSEAYLNFHLWRTGKLAEFKPAKISQLNRRLREMLAEEKVPEEKLVQFSKTGALPDTVVGALSQFKIAGLTKAAKWSGVVKGKVSLPTFRSNMAIPIRCDKAEQCRLERTPEGNVELNLMVRLRPYPRVVIQTGAIGDGARAVLNRLLDNESQDPAGYRQRCFEIKHDERSNKWWLFVTYELPITPRPTLDPNRVIGVDLGVSCPLYAAVKDGFARLGWRQFAALGARIRSLQNQTVARRRSMLSGGRSILSNNTARSGHGRKRKIQSIEKLNDRINRAYTTLNHQLSSAVIAFALDNGAGTIQMEDLTGLKDKLTGTFLGARWRYHQLQSFLEYKATEAGIEIRKVEPRYTSRRCSKCGHIHLEFTRAFRDANRVNGRVARFICPSCSFEADPDYNAAKNLAHLDIVDLIKQQCVVQNIRWSGSLETETEVVDTASLA